MREVDAQKEFIDAVKEAGGMGHKQSNRFLVGVADLAIKLPGYPLAMIEAKMADVVTATQVTVEPTEIQLKFLRDYDRAGTVGGVVSFVTRGRQFGVCFLALREFDRSRKISVLTGIHYWCPMGPAHRQALILEQFRQFMHSEESKWAR